ncbi:hypothetical protein [Methanocalculus sp.]|uniref:hypothetical protein n=1 Tax=Methanocalculus sp. TaxID=2004547 RepID=UPI00272578A6|nr:hypothetical protein [Methanocalculus sp.]MDO8842372.1 hypothetical protein [Methanocalculus sp.]
MIDRRRIWISFILIALLITPGSAVMIHAVDDVSFIINQEQEIQPAEMTLLIYNSMDGNQPYGQVRIRITPSQQPMEFQSPTQNMMPRTISSMTWTSGDENERTQRIFHIKRYDPYFPLMLSAKRLKMWMNPSTVPNMNVYMVNTIPVQPEETEILEWRSLNGGEIDYSTLHIPADRDRLWVDLRFEGYPLIFTAYSPDTILGPFEDGDDDLIDGRIYLEIAGEDAIPEGEWYFRIENTGQEETWFAFTIWY